MSEIVDSNSLTLKDYGINELLSKEAMYVSWLEVEKAVAQAQGELGIIPEEVANAIKQKAQYQNINWEKVNTLYLKQGHSFYPFVEVLSASCGEAGKYVHFGITTQNVQQTGEFLVAKEINSRILIMISDILENLAELANKYSSALMPGRTHGRHAVPITFGYKVATWISEVLGATQRLKNFHNSGFTSMCGGAVGAYNALGERGPELNDRVGAILGLTPMDVPSRNIHSSILEYINELAMVVNPINRIAEEVYLTSLREIGELSETYVEGQIGSSTMPQKINPKLSKGIIANSEKLYSIVGSLYYASARPFEADSSTNMLLDDQLRTAMGLTKEVLMRAEKLTKTIQVNSNQMEKNAFLTQGLDNTENIMINLAKMIGRPKAHEIVYKIAMQSEREGTSFSDNVLANEVLNKYFSLNELKSMLNPKNYIGLSVEIAKSQAKKATDQAFILRQLYLN
ncbi:adenylosuccinate lyase family protein [Pediococcus ethanolidurans]|uniref:class-II fumarase/aspartase family protein n=1 Tax=Pediococcus ethanolidurans TaxID=319653 RepID=UPI0021E72AB2|nr:adenylosuccinate lyase family protein [Pediococcus ethanolidurans]MCV3328174.1 adenylosuccinate lyase family protein [Pediococcus ethanolidurans]